MPKRIVCGWCGRPTIAARFGKPANCEHCRRDPRRPWEQRAQRPPEVADDRAAGGRPALSAGAITRLYADARAAIAAEGREPTVEAIAERLERSPRTVRQWRQRFGLR